MNPTDDPQAEPGTSPSFFARPQAQVEQIAIGKGIPLGIEQVSNPAVGIGGAYGTWGDYYDNQHLPALLERRLGEPLAETERMNLSELGFDARHHLPDLTAAEHLELELEVGARFLRAAAQASGWQPADVQGVLIGSSGPVAEDFTEQIARRAGIPEEALKVSIHKACDGSVAGLHLALNPRLPATPQGMSLAEALAGKKVLVGGIEGLSRFTRMARDKIALQMFGNGAGVIGIIPGESLKFLTGRTHEAFDVEGVLEVRMYYPYSKERAADQSLVQVTQPSAHHIRVAGLMHEPEDEEPVVMAGPMGMVKLFVRTGVQVVKEVYENYRGLMDRLGQTEKSIAVAIVHHANYKINRLKEKHLQKEGIELPMPWLLNEFGNVSAASNMIAFLRKLSSLSSGDHVLFDGFGAGTYYDALVVELGG